jgi:hypothetical protein
MINTFTLDCKDSLYAMVDLFGVEQIIIIEHYIAYKLDLNIIYFGCFDLSLSNKSWINEILHNAGLSSLNKF